MINDYTKAAKAVIRYKQEYRELVYELTEALKNALPDAVEINIPNLSAELFEGDIAVLNNDKQGVKFIEV